MLLNHLIVFLQFGHKERSKITLLFKGIRWIQTFAKLPQIQPSKKKIMENTN